MIRPTLALLLLAAGCGEEAAVAPVLSDECHAPADCLADQVCEAGVCVADRPNQITVSLQVRPPATTGYLRQQFQGIHLLEGRRIPDLLLTSPVSLSGRLRVSIDDNPLANSVPGRVLLKRRDSIPGTSVRFDAAAADGQGYELPVVPGRYDLSVFPDNEVFPPYREEDFEVRQDTVRDIFLPKLSDYRRLAGRVVVEEADAGGLAGIRVIALSPDATLLSTEDTTDAEGHFDVSLPPVDGVWTLRLSPTDLNPLVPSVDFPDIGVPEDGELGDIVLGAGGDQAALACLRILGNGNPLPGTTVELASEQGHGVFTASVTTDEETDRLRVALMPGAYTVRIVPPIDSDFAVTRLTDVAVDGSVDEGCTDLGDVHVEAKRAFEGVLMQPGDAPAPDVTIEALLTGNGDVKGLRRRVVATTHKDGRFVLRVDPGLHDLTFIPPEHSGLPRWTERSVEIRKDTLRAETLRLKDPDLISGVVRSPDGYPLADASVEVYLVPEDGTDALLIGLGSTDADGRYTIVLPNP